jgi:hypothetical protein
MVPFRAIENGISIYRLTSQGIALAIDQYGRTLGSMDATRVDQRVFVVQLPNRRVLTVYSVVARRALKQPSHRKLRVALHDFDCAGWALSGATQLPPSQTQRIIDMQQVEIRIKGCINHQWSEWFGGLTIIHSSLDETVLTGPILDEAALINPNPLASRIP